MLLPVRIVARTVRVSRRVSWIWIGSAGIRIGAAGGAVAHHYRVLLFLFGSTPFLFEPVAFDRGRVGGDRSVVVGQG
jgi:hypothetical protein